MNSIWFIVLFLSRVWSCMPSLSGWSISLLNHICSFFENALSLMITIIVNVNSTITTHCMNKGFFSITIVISTDFSNLLNLSHFSWSCIVHSRGVYWNCFNVSDWLNLVNCGWSCILNSFLWTIVFFGRINNFCLAFIKISDPAFIFLNGRRYYLSSTNISCISNFLHFIGIFYPRFITVICCCSYSLRYRSWINSSRTFRYQVDSFWLWKGF